MKYNIPVFLDNKYYRWYNQIINNAYKRLIRDDQYYEKHHIIPKSICQELRNEKTNLVLLTPREHFLCHILLTKFTTGRDRFKMSKALTMLMHIKNIGDRTSYSINSRWYEYQKNIAAIAKLEYWTDDTRKHHSNKLKEYNKTVDKTSEKYINRIKKIQDYQKNEKEWSELAIKTRTANCLKNAANNKGKPWSSARRNSYVPYTQSEESNSKRRESLKGRKTSSGMKGKHHSIESKEKIRHSNKGRVTPETFRGYWFRSPENIDVLFCPVGPTAKKHGLCPERLRMLRLGRIKRNNHKGWIYIRIATESEIETCRTYITRNHYE